MLNENIINPAQTEWASSIVFVSNEDGTPRFCVDDRKLDAVTTRDSYSVPQMDTCIDSLGDAIIISALDPKSAYWQMEIDEVNRDKTSFTFPHKLHTFIWELFKLRSALGTFQRTMDVIFSAVEWQYALAYADDTVVVRKFLEEHFVIVRDVLRHLSNADAIFELK